MGGRQCPHLVDICVDGFVNRGAIGSSPERVFDFSLDWKHGWFVEHDPDSFAHQFLWEIVAGDDYRGFRPDGPYRIRRTQSYRRVPRTDLRVSVHACFIVALDAPTFCAELRDGDRRLQAFWSRNRGAEA